MAGGSASYTQYYPVKQEELLAYDVGSKMSLAQRTLQLNLAAYYYDYKDKQLIVSFIDPVFGVLPRLGNVPKSRVYRIATRCPILSQVTTSEERSIAGPRWICGSASSVIAGEPSRGGTM